MNSVLVDVDDTIADTQLVLLETVNARLGSNYTFEGMTRAHREDGHREWNEAVWEILKDPNIMMTVHPSEYALAAMGELVKAGRDVHIVSSRQEPLHAATSYWLQLHGFAQHVTQIHPRMSSEKGTAFKVRICQEVGFDAAFDDTFDVIAAIAPYVGTAFMINKPWNHGYDDELPTNVVRVPSFAVGVDNYLKQGK